MAEEVKYVPYDDDDLVIGKIVIHKKYRNHDYDKRMIIGQGKGYVIMCDGTVNYSRLFETYVSLDGTPAGRVSGIRDQGSVVSGQLSVASDQCEHKDRVIEDHESCIRGKIIRLVCVDCGKVLDTDIIR